MIEVNERDFLHAKGYVFKKEGTWLATLAIGDDESSYFNYCTKDGIVYGHPLGNHPDMSHEECIELVKCFLIFKGIV